jgi:hypothetical protein
MKSTKCLIALQERTGAAFESVANCYYDIPRLMKRQENFTGEKEKGLHLCNPIKLAMPACQQFVL